MGGKGRAYIRYKPTCGTGPRSGTALCGRGLPVTHRALGRDHALWGGDRALWAGLTSVYPPSSWTGLRSVGGAYPCQPTELWGGTTRSVGQNHSLSPLPKLWDVSTLCGRDFVQGRNRGPRRPLIGPLIPELPGLASADGIAWSLRLREGVGPGERLVGTPFGR